jgi:hypothetical protein
MSDAMKPLRTYPAFIDLMKGMKNPLLGLLISALFTTFIQSSSATTGVIIVLAQQSLISLEAGIPLVFGANIGTCITAELASIGTSRDAKRVALSHVVFKVSGVLLFIFWIPEFSNLIRMIAVRFGVPSSRSDAATGNRYARRKNRFYRGEYKRVPFQGCRKGRSADLPSKSLQADPASRNFFQGNRLRQSA